MKTVEQQGLQSIQRSRYLLIQECIALSNHMRGILLEFGVTIPQGFASLLRTLPEVLEDGDNDCPTCTGRHCIDFTAACSSCAAILKP